MEEAIIEKLDLFFAKYRSYSFKKGDLIIRAAEETTKIYYLREGFVRQYLITPDGEEVTLTIFKPISYFPLMIALSRRKNKYYFEAVTPVELRACPPADIIAFLKREPDVLFDLTHRFADGLNGLLAKIENMLYENAYAKVVSLMLYLANRFGEKDGKTTVIVLPLTHHDIASWVGLQRETVSRQMEKLAKKGIIGGKHHFITVKRMEKLKEEMQIFHPE